ncbi:MAG: hypothetical protein IPG82_16335 [Saprospiraceae bacterium]|nr:hypothetical protein [Saprospiraceae bacterium]
MKKTIYSLAVLFLMLAFGTLNAKDVLHGNDNATNNVTVVNGDKYYDSGRLREA